MLGDLELAKITPTKVRDWHSELLRADKPGNTTVAKCYRLLHAILNAAVVDELLQRNPCVIKGAGQEKAPERPIASIPQVFEIADMIERRFRAMVLVGAFVGLRLGEMLALTRERVDLDRGRIKVVEQYQELKDGTRVLGPPKSDAGIGTVAIPALLKPELEAHLATFAAPGKKGLAFCGSDGQPLRRASWYTAWGRAMTALDIEGMKPRRERTGRRRSPESEELPPWTGRGLLRREGPAERQASFDPGAEIVVFGEPVDSHVDHALHRPAGEVHLSSVRLSERFEPSVRPHSDHELVADGAAGPAVGTDHVANPLGESFIESHSLSVGPR